MKAVVFHGIGDIRLDNIKEPKIQDDQDAIVRMTRSRLRVDAENVAAELQTDRLQAGALLDELVKEGKLVEQRVTGGGASYRLKGL